MGIKVDWFGMINYKEECKVHLYGGVEAQEFGNQLLTLPTYMPPTDLYFTYTPSLSTSISVGTVTQTVNEVQSGVAITFTASNTTINNSIVELYIWDFGDGIVERTSNSTIIHTFNLINYQLFVTLTAYTKNDRKYTCRISVPFT